MDVKDFDGTIDGAGVKFDQQKLRTDLVPPQAMKALAEVYTHGAIKYADNNWMRGMDYSRPYGAMMRHMLSWYEGQDIDPDSGLSHLYHAMWCVATLIYFSQDPKYHQFDNRVFRVGEQVEPIEHQSLLDPVLAALYEGYRKQAFPKMVTEEPPAHHNPQAKGRVECPSCHLWYNSEQGHFCFEDIEV